MNEAIIKKVNTSVPSIRKNKSELQVVTKAKDLCSYILTITQKSTKKFRFTLVTRLQNLALDVIQDIYEANEIYLKNNTQQKINERICKQRSALTKIKLIAYLSHLAREQSCILPKHFENISAIAHDCQYLLAAWIKKSKEGLESQKRTIDNSSAE